MNQKTDWSKDIPTEPGWYEMRCDETERKPEPVQVFIFQNELWVEDDNIGKYPLDHYHNNLIHLEWRRKTEVIHVIPIGNDEPVHTASEKCWCNPIIKDIATHNAKDCREKYERQGLTNDNSKWAIVRQEVNDANRQ